MKPNNGAKPNNVKTNDSAKANVRARAAGMADMLTGREERMREMYRAAFADAGADALIGKARKTNRTILTAAALLIAAVSLLWVSEALGPEEAELDLRRDSPGGAARTVTAEAHAEYGSEAIDEQLTIRVLPREPGAEEAAAMVQDVMRRLPTMILGENPSVSEVTYDLRLPRADEQTGADISWSSSDKAVISDDGYVNPVGAEAGQQVVLSAHIRLGEAWDTLAIALRVGQPPDGYDLAQALRQRLKEIVRAASASREGETAALPGEAQGVRIDWRTPRRSGHLPELFIGMFILAVAFRYRYRAVEKRIAEAHGQIERDFPDFIGKLGLLLGAGLVITSAIERITEDYCQNRRVNDKRQLYEELVAMRERMQAGNTPLVYEFADIARRSGLREVMRFSSILADNIDKGSALADKLEQENRMLWDGRKRRAEKEGRIAETRLIFPMVLQVLVVVIVTVAPAAFEMR